MTMLVSMAGALRGSFSSVVNLVPSAIRAGISAGRIMEITDLLCICLEKQSHTAPSLDMCRTGGTFKPH